jgi:hypothetical protein
MRAHFRQGPDALLPTACPKTTMTGSVTSLLAKRFRWLRDNERTRGPDHVDRRIIRDPFSCPTAGSRPYTVQSRLSRFIYGEISPAADHIVLGDAADLDSRFRRIAQKLLSWPDSSRVFQPWLRQDSMQRPAIPRIHVRSACVKRGPRALLHRKRLVWKWKQLRTITRKLLLQLVRRTETMITSSSCG